MSDPNVSLDSQFTALAVQRHVMDHAMSLDAPSAKQLAAMQKQKEGVAEGLADVAREMGAHLVDEVANGACSAASTLYTLTSAWHRAWEEGSALAQAHQRDAVTLAIIEAGAAALPAGYASKMIEEYKDVAGGGGASTVLTAAMAGGHWDELKAQAEASIRTGRETAGKFKLTTPEALAARLQADPNFAARYHQDTAFRIGVECAVYYGHA
jgi:hypothetical protein